MHKYPGILPTNQTTHPPTYQPKSTNQPTHQTNQHPFNRPPTICRQTKQQQQQKTHPTNQLFKRNGDVNVDKIFKSTRKTANTLSGYTKIAQLTRQNQQTNQIKEQTTNILSQQQQQKRIKGK